MKNFMIFIFSYQARLYLAYVFIALNILQVLAGCIMTIGSIYICLAVTKNLYAEKAEIQFVFSVFAIFGTHIIIQYLIGIKLVQLCFVKAHKRSTKRNLYLWLIICCNTILDLLILAGLIVRISKHIVRSIRHSMEKGMRHYLSDPLWKHTIDQWQFSLRCCGVNDYKDWYMISWLDKYRIKVDSSTVKSLLLSKDHLHLPIIPWSCCDIDFPMQCFHDPLQQIDSVHMWQEQPEVTEMSIYRTGCLEIIRYPIEMCLVIILAICVILLFIQLGIVIISRFLYTSCRNAVIMRNCLGKAPGWLFTRDCLAERRGRTLSEIMFDLEHHAENSNESDDDASAETSVLLKATNLQQLTSHPSSRPPPISTRRESLMKNRFGAANRHNVPYRPSLNSSSSMKHNTQHAPRVPPRRESQTKPPLHKKRDSQRSMNVSSLTTDNDCCDIHSCKWRSRKPLDYLIEVDEREDQSDDCEICARDSARDPICSGAEDMLMLR